MKANNNSARVLVSLEDILHTLAEMNSDDLDGDWGCITRESSIETYLSSLEAEDRVKKASKILYECREFEDIVYKFIIHDLEKRTAQTIKEYHDKRELILSKGIKVKKQTFTATEVINISGSSRNTIYNHLKNGTLRGIQNGTGGWTITREALQEYLHRDDF